MSNLMQKWMARAVRRAARNGLKHNKATLAATLKASLAAAGVGAMPKPLRPFPGFSPFNPFTRDSPFARPAPTPTPSTPPSTPTPAPTPNPTPRQADNAADNAANSAADDADNDADNGADNSADNSAANDQAQGRFIPGSHSGPQGLRNYKLYLPPPTRLAPAAPAAPAAPLPLVVMLHGCTQNPDDFAAGTQMNVLAAAEGFLVLYPEQAATRQPQRCWNWFKHNHQARDRGEPAALVAMIKQVAAEHAVDSRRVYIAGLSAGGAMAAILGNAYPELFAAVGVHSGLPAGAARDLPTALAAMQGRAPAPKPGRTMAPPTIVFHGDADSTVHPVNGERVLDAAALGPAVQIAVPAAVQAAVQAPPAGPGAPGPAASGHRATRYVHRDGSGHILAERWVVHGAGHAWSGGSSKGSFTDAQGPDASAEMWRFFSGHSL